MRWLAPSVILLSLLGLPVAALAQVVIDDAPDTETVVVQQPPAAPFVPPQTMPVPPAAGALRDTLAIARLRALRTDPQAADQRPQPEPIAPAPVAQLGAVPTVTLPPTAAMPAGVPAVPAEIAAATIPDAGAATAPTPAARTPVSSIFAVPPPPFPPVGTLPDGQSSAMPEADLPETPAAPAAAARPAPAAMPLATDLAQQPRVLTLADAQPRTAPTAAAPAATEPARKPMAAAPTEDAAQSVRPPAVATRAAPDAVQSLGTLRIPAPVEEPAAPVLAAPSPPPTVAPISPPVAPAVAAPEPVAPAPAKSASAKQAAPAIKIADGGLRLLFAATSEAPDPALANDLTAWLADRPADKRLVLRAYAVVPGAQSPREARRLSLNRALAVRDLLVAQGLQPEQMDIKALGQPADDGPSDRVDLSWE